MAYLRGLLSIRPQLAPEIPERAVESGVLFTWFAVDEVCGSGRKLPPWLVNPLLAPDA